MDHLKNEDLDNYLLNQKGRVIHQIWFGIIPSKHKARKDFEGLRKYRDSWLNNNSTWGYKCWDFKDCRNFMKTYFPEHIEMYDNYPYHIQRCDCVRYFILYRYGGLYADMDYCCMKSWDEVISKYNNDIYLVETPNKVSGSVHISNSLMYSRPGHPYWKHVFIEMQKNQHPPRYYGRHLTIMYTTGPCIINRVFERYRREYKIGFYPYKLFHPFGLTTDIDTSGNHKSDIYAYHLGKGSWENGDSKILLFFYREYKIILLILIFLILPEFFQFAKMI
jgi:mannosyltransferase OCH1-like enzyme